MDKRENRLCWIDQLKGLGIILVVLGHSIEYVDYSIGTVDPIMKSLNFWLTSFHMPLFFLTSAFLQRLSEVTQGEYRREKIKVKVINLLGTYIIFSFVFLLSKWVMSDNVQNPVDCWDVVFLWFKPLSTLWFIYLLLVFWLLRVIIYKLKIPNKYILSISSIMCICSYYVKVPLMLQATVLIRFMKYALFYSLGILLCDYKDVFLPFCKQKKHVIAVFLIIVSAVLLFVGYNTRFSLVMILLTLFELLLFILLSGEVKKTLFMGLGRNSLGIYFMHDYIICLVVIISKKIMKLLFYVRLCYRC